MSSRRQRNIPLGGRYRQVSLYILKAYYMHRVPVEKNTSPGGRYWDSPKNDIEATQRTVISPFFLITNHWIVLGVNSRLYLICQIITNSILVYIFAYQRNDSRDASTQWYLWNMLHIEADTKCPPFCWRHFRVIVVWNFFRWSRLPQTIWTTKITFIIVYRCCNNLYLH